MNSALSRRQFIVRAGVAAGSLLVRPSFAKISPNEKLNIGVIGTANRANDDLQRVASENIVALCDVDATYLAAAHQSFPKAALYRDFRKMLERKDLDAVVVGAPDHIHAVAAIAAMQSGRHVYCEKPLAHSVAEARRMAEVARQHNCITQMGTQIHASENYHEVVKKIQGGIIGPVREAHVWVSKVYTAHGLPEEKPAVPEKLDWSLWLGPTERRSYSPEYVPKQWRRYWAFGGGTLADMGCHYIDLIHWSLGLRAPLSVESEGPPVDSEGTPDWMIARYEYPEREDKPAVKMTWYHGKQDGKLVRPPHFERGELPDWGDGVLFVGEKGMLLSGYFKHVLLPEKNFPDQPVWKSHNDDCDTKHHDEWINAIKNGGVTSCNFDYSGALTEAVLLGNVAYRSGAKVDWNPASLTARGNSHAEKFIQYRYRHGWKI